MLLRISVLVLLAGLTGCVSTASWLTGLEPVTPERCQKMDVRMMGFDDGKLGRRNGDKFEFWQKDCASVGASLDRNLYDEGYTAGINEYCSCENGFMAGVKDEYAELKLQYQMCRGVQYKQYISGHEKGKLEIKNEKLSRKVGQFKIEYDEPAISTLAKATCSTATP